MLIRQTLLYLPAQALGPIMQLVAMVVWTHFLPPAEMGVLALVTSAQELIYTGTLSWFSYYTQRYFDASAPPGERQRFLNSEAGVLAGASILALLAAPLLVVVIDPAWTASVMGATIVYAVMRGVATQLADRARTAHEALAYSILQIAWPLFGLVLGAILASYWQPTAAAVLWGYAVAQTITLAGALPRLRLGRHPLAIDRAAIRQAVRYGAPLILGAALVWVAANGLRFVVEWQQGAAAVGLMTVGWGLGQRAAAFAAMLVTAAAFPLAMRRAREEGFASGQSQLVMNGVLLVAALAPVTAGLAVIARPLVELFVAAPFREVTIAVLPLSLVGGAIRNFRMHFGEQVFLLHARPMVPVWNDLFDAVATLGIATLGLAVWSLEGAVAGAAVGAALSLVVTLFCGWRWYRFALPPGDVVRIGASAGAMAIAVHTISPAADLVSLALAVAAGATVYAAAIALCYPAEVVRVANKLRKKLPLSPIEKEAGPA